MFQRRPLRPLATVSKAARRTIERAQPWPDRLARGGYVAKGALFLVVGGLAAAAAGGLGGETTDPSGALVAVARAPAGRFILAVAALALLAHAAFRATLVLVGEAYDERGRAWRWWRAIVNAVSAAFYAYISLKAAALALGVGGPGRADTDNDQEARHWSARLLSAPYGRWLLGGVAVAILIAAGVQVARAFSPNAVRRRLRIDEMSHRQRLVVSAVGRLALLARGTIFASIGYFLAKAAARWSPGAARGSAGALHAVWEQPHGGWLLGLVAVGLVALGAFGLLEARWRRLFGR